MATSSTTQKVDVPICNGEADKLSSYRFEVSMLVKSFKTADLYVCGPQLACPKIDEIDTVDQDGKLTGWEAVFSFVLDKLDYTSLNDTGLLAEEFFLKLNRNVGETFQDWAARFEKKERELLTQLRAIDNDVEEVIAKPLRAWWFLRKSRLTPVLRGEVTATSGGDYNFAKTYKTLLTRFPAEALAELDGRKKEGALFEDEPGHDRGEAGDEEDDIYDVLEQLINLADEEDDTEEEVADHEADNEVFAQFRQAGRSFKDARDLMRRLRVSRDYCPVVATREGGDRRPPPPRPHSEGRPKGGGKGRGRSDRDRDMSKMKCINCKQFGHRARDCPERRHDGGHPKNPSTHNGFFLSALDEYVYLLERDGIWAILDIGATRSLGGVESIENLMYEMLDQHDAEFEAHDDTCSFTFGDGLQKSSMGAVSGKVFLGPELRDIRLSAMPNRVPALIGMDILTDDLKVVVDCGRNWLGLPTLGNRTFYCERLSSKHLAINLSSPQWWKEVPLSLSLGPDVVVNMAKSEPEVLEKHLEPDINLSQDFEYHETNDVEQSQDCENHETNDVEQSVQADSAPVDAMQWRFLWTFFGAATTAAVAAGVGKAADEGQYAHVAAGRSPSDSNNSAAAGRTSSDSGLGAVHSKFGVSDDLAGNTSVELQPSREVCPKHAGLPHPSDPGFRGAGRSEPSGRADPSDAPSGAPSVEVWGCSCKGGKSHHCLREQLEQPDQDIRGMAVALRWRRVASKLANKDPEDWDYLSLPSKTDTMLDDSELPDLVAFQQAHDKMNKDIYLAAAEDVLVLTRPWELQYRPKVVEKTAFYPPAMCRTWAKHILQKSGSVRYGMEIFAALDQATKDDAEMEDISDEEFPEGDDTEEAEETTFKGLGLETDLTKKVEVEIEQRLARLHRNLGHSSNKTLYKILKVINTWESWNSHYRRPALLRLDPQGCHWSQAVAKWTSDRGIELWIAPGEAHWLMGKVERRMQLFRRLMTKLATLDPECPVKELISWP
ncbi:unnamed protein product [Prorocentrum cordatum]|uniref:CCHC-type domain-containing protein n=1 Tax=Prorocentrum cordatum TaxID=2364126 RepID=A0ABN9VF51_9DINO|nr:unnamed protein product [Polarella glacialis]